MEPDTKALTHARFNIFKIINNYGELKMAKLARKGVESLVPYPPGKPIEELERELGIKGSIKLASNENPLGPSPLAAQAIVDKVQGLHRYPDGSGYYLKDKLSEKYGLGVRASGVSELVLEAMVTSSPAS